MIRSGKTNYYCRDARRVRGPCLQTNLRTNARKVGPVLLPALLALILAGCSEPGEEAGIAGYAEYQRACSTCHGRDGDGRAPTFPPLAGSEWLDLGPESVALVVLLGLKGEIEVAGRTWRGFMPHMRQLPDADVATILDYINQRWAGWDEVPGPAQIAELRSFTDQRAILEGRDDLEQLLEELRR